MHTSEGLKHHSQTWDPKSGSHHKSHLPVVMTKCNPPSQVDSHSFWMRREAWLKKWIANTPRAEKTSGNLHALSHSSTGLFNGTTRVQDDHAQEERLKEVLDNTCNKFAEPNK